MHRQLLQYDPLLGIRWVPGVKGWADAGFLVRVNQSGFRSDREFEPRKKPGTSRMLLFGDSFTAGHGVSNGRRYGDVLERLVPGLEVLNFGINGTGTDQHYLAFREMAPQLEHDLVMIGVYVENIRRIKARSRVWASNSEATVVVPKPYFTLTEDGGLDLHNVPVPRPTELESLSAEDRSYVDTWGARVLRRRAVNRLGPRAKRLAQWMTRYQPVPEYDHQDDPGWLLMKRILSQLIDESSVPVLIVPIPQRQHFDKVASSKAYQARFQELHDPPRSSVHDPLPHFHSYPRAERKTLRLTGDPHLSPRGHEVLAEFLAPYVRSLLTEAAARIHGGARTVTGARRGSPAELDHA